MVSVMSNVNVPSQSSWLVLLVLQFVIGKNLTVIVVDVLQVVVGLPSSQLSLQQAEQMHLSQFPLAGRYLTTLGVFH